MKRRALFTAMTASCLLASTAVDAQRYSAPAYRPPPPPPPSYAPPPPRYTPPPASNQNTRQGSQSGGAYQGSQQRSSPSSSNLGGYRPGSIANSNSQVSGKQTGPSTQSGTGGATKSAGSGTAKQAGGPGFGKGQSTPANDTAKAAAKTGTKTAAQTAGAGAFGAKQATSGNDTRKKQQSNEEFCKGANLSSTRCQSNCANLSPRPSYCPPPPAGSQVVKTETR
jgi:hypothetical protein